MRLKVAVLAWLGLAGLANAAPIALVCNGNLNIDGQQVMLKGETAIVDFEKRSFKPPLYPALPITRLNENDITFGNESADYSTWGGLDRVSGNLTMNVMRPEERKKLQAGGSARFLTWMSAKCVPAQRMF